MEEYQQNSGDKGMPKQQSSETSNLPEIIHQLEQLIFFYVTRWGSM